MLQVVGFIGFGITALIFTRYLRRSTACHMAEMTDDQLRKADIEAHDWAENANPALVEIHRRQIECVNTPAP